MLEMKMNKLLAICLLFVFCASSWVNGVQLDYLCPNATFTFNGLLVNAVHRFKANNFTYHPIGHYMIDESCRRSSFDNRTNYAEAERIKSEYNSLIIRYYSEKFVNNFDFIEKADLFLSFYDRIPRYQKELDQIIRLENNGRVKCVYKYLQRVKISGVPFLESLTSYLSEQFIQSYGLGNKKSDEHIPKVEAEMVKLRGFIDSLDANENQQFVLADHPMKKIYKLHVVKPGPFSVKRRSRFFFDKKQTGTFTYNVLLPFHAKIEYDPVKHSCLAEKELSKWFTREDFREPAEN